MKSFVFLYFSLLLSAPLYAQGSLDLREEDAVRVICDRNITNNKSRKEVSGWSVMILNTDDRTQAEQGKVKFATLYPTILADWDYEAPYYRLKAGACRKKIEATTIMYAIREHYPDAYLIKNNKIKPKDL